MSKKQKVLQYISQQKGKKQINKDELQARFEELQKISSSEGLTENEINDLVEFLTTTKLVSSISLVLLSCLIPQTKISAKTLEELMLWYFVEAGNERISSAVEKKFFQWLTAITQYELADKTVLDSYYHSFLFLLNKTHLESLVCRLLCLISKPEDAKRWVVQQILQIQSVSGPKAHTNSLLGLLKSYRPDVVPEAVPMFTFYSKPSFFDEVMSAAHLRKLDSDSDKNDINDVDTLQWNTWKIYDGKSRKLTRLIPPTESCNIFERNREKKKGQSITEFKTMASLGVHALQMELPAQNLSLLTNLAGYHILCFSNSDVKSRFYHKLYYTLCRVFLLQMEPYSEEEKANFLSSIKGLQEYAQQGISVVTVFLLDYLPIWDGHELLEQILGLVEWIEVNEKDLEDRVFPSLRQFFLSTGTHNKCLVIDTMGKLMRNLLGVSKREQNCFRNDILECDTVKSIEAVAAFVRELIVNGLNWNNDKSSRNILMTALDFYEISYAVEQAGDLPTIMIMPPILVYKCLFSGSRLCVARLSSLLVRLQLNSVEKLYSLGVFEDFATEVEKLNIYLLDYYRCLWSDVNFRKEDGSFIFNANIFCNAFWKLKENYGNVMDRIFGVDYSSTFWEPQTNGLREIVVQRVAEDFPSIIQLKQVVEEHLQVMELF